MRSYSFLIAIGLVGWTVTNGYGVILGTGGGSQNTSDPGVGNAWSHVGAVGSASGVFLGTFETGSWVLTGWHVPETAFVLEGTTYNAVNGSSVRVLNPDNSPTDLRLFLIDDDPGLLQLDIVEQSVATGTALTMIGVGRNREEEITRWTSDWQETTDLGEAVFAGHRWAPGREKRWGTNTVDGFQTFNAGFGDVEGFHTDFDRFVTDQGQGATGDSGGGVFTADGQLAGLMLAVGSFPDQPAETSVFGNTTLIADLAATKSFIETVVIPEPSTTRLLFVGLMAGLAGRRFR